MVVPLILSVPLLLPPISEALPLTFVFDFRFRVLLLVLLVITSTSPFISIPVSASLASRVSELSYSQTAYSFCSSVPLPPKAVTLMPSASLTKVRSLLLPSMPCAPCQAPVAAVALMLIASVVCTCTVVLSTAMPCAQFLASPLSAAALISSLPSMSASIEPPLITTALAMLVVLV